MNVFARRRRPVPRVCLPSGLNRRIKAMRTLYSNVSPFAIIAAAPADTASGAAANQDTGAKAAEEATSIPKPPPESKLSRFKSKNLGREKVATQIAGLPHHSVPEAKDWVRLHPDEENWWSDELCFVSIPVPGQKRDMLHLIDTDQAAELPSGKVARFRLALASKPNDGFFLAHVPSTNLDNKWNETNVDGCEQAKTLWTQLTSRRGEGVEGYDISMSEAEKKGKKPFPEPNWEKVTKGKTLEDLIVAAFAGRIIDSETNPAWLRLIADVQTLA
jgi:hypothetical protein